MYFLYEQQDGKNYKCTFSGDYDDVLHELDDLKVNGFMTHEYIGKEVTEAQAEEYTKLVHRK